MAYDRIITVRTRLDKCLNYAMNSAKNERHLCAAINCNTETAFADMEATKERWNRKGGVLGYHLFAFALMCVPSMKTIVGSSIRLFSALFRICAKISSVSSVGNLLQKA